MTGWHNGDSTARNAGQRPAAIDPRRGEAPGAQGRALQTPRPGLDRRTFLSASLAVLGAGLGTSLLAACGQAAAPAAAPAPPSPTVAKPAAPATQTAAPAAAGPRKVSLRFNWTIKGEFTPFFVAREKGFYQEAGIAPELLEGKSGTQAAQVVSTGNDQFGYIPSIQVIQGINQGMPIQTIATCGKNTGMCWASWPDVPLAGPKALEGHKVSISSSSTFFQVWDAFARKFNVDKSKVEVVSADPSARVGLFLARQIDIMADIFLANDYVILVEKSKQKLNLLKLADLDFDPVGYLLVATKSVLQGDKPLARAFTQASLRGFQYTLDHPDEATQIMTRLYGERLGGPVIAGQVKQLLSLVNTSPALGRSERTPWEQSLDLLQQSGVIDKKLALDQYYTNDLLAA